MLSKFSQLLYGASSLLTGQYRGFSSNPFWKDKSLSFDLRSWSLDLNKGEQLIACFFPIEDAKGNQDELGVLRVTNQRLIWICCTKKRVNLTIGWRTVSLAFEQKLKDPLGSPIPSLCVLTKYESTKYEFIFNKLNGYWADLTCGDGGPDNIQSLLELRHLINQDRNLITHLSPTNSDNPFEVVFRVWQSYKRTTLFRHCRANLVQLMSGNQSDIVSSSSDMSHEINQSTLRSSASNQGTNLKVTDINKLPGEDIIDIYTDIVQIESKSTRHNGTMVLTNIRLIWIDEQVHFRNISVPYIRINSMKLKQAERVQISTCDYLATSNQIEFRVAKTLGDSAGRRTRIVFEQLQDLYDLYKSRPKFGPESCDECLNFMAQLRPIDHYLAPLDSQLIDAEAIEDFGPAVKRVGRSTEPFDNDYNSKTDPLDPKRNYGKNLESEGPIKRLGAMESASQEKVFVDIDMDRREAELQGYSAKLSNYLNEMPANRNQDLIYSEGKWMWNMR